MMRMSEYQRALMIQSIDSYISSISDEKSKQAWQMLSLVISNFEFRQRKPLPDFISDQS